MKAIEGASYIDGDETWVQLEDLTHYSYLRSNKCQISNDCQSQARFLGQNSSWTDERENIYRQRICRVYQKEISLIKDRQWKR